MPLPTLSVTGAPRIDEDTMPGELANVVAGRVSNLLDLQGPNFAMDAACASSQWLRSWMPVACCRLRQVDVMLAGATDRSMDPPTFSKFSAIGALVSYPLYAFRCKVPTDS